MLGYLFAALIGLVLILFVVGLIGGRRSRSAGRIDGGGTVTYEQPAADEPTPGASDTARPNQARKAQRHTPPA